MAKKHKKDPKKDTAGQQTASEPEETVETEDVSGETADGKATDAEAPAEESQETAGETAAEVTDDTVPRDEYNALNDRLLRTVAEYDNFRKRTARERQELLKTATEQLMRDMLPILDNLDRATEHRSDKTTYEEYVKGIALIEDQLRDILKNAGLEVIEVVGCEFDPNIHDAVMQVESDEHDAGVVTAEVERGYRLSGKVIRHPKVIVSK